MKNNCICRVDICLAVKRFILKKNLSYVQASKYTAFLITLDMSVMEYDIVLINVKVKVRQYMNDESKNKWQLDRTQIQDLKTKVAR